MKELSFVRPRLIDHFNIPISQEDAAFAIPFLDEDIPLFLDPFLLWKSPSQQDNALHAILINSFNHLGALANKGELSTARSMLINLSECDEVGLGMSKTKKGLRISEKTANEVLDLFRYIPQVKNSGFTHFEEVQLYVANISKDRISDIACNLLKSFLIDFTQNECRKYGIPMNDFDDIPIYQSNTNGFVSERVSLPYNPQNNLPIILMPKRWLRYIPWINYEDYFKNSFVKVPGETQRERVAVLDYNRKNYDVVKAYIAEKERVQADCKNDPLFKQIPILSAKRALNGIIKLPTGKTDNADKQYEDGCVKLLASIMYPHLDFAQEQSRIESGSQIRDLIFYNNCSYPFLEQLYKDYDCKQIVFEMKNVADVSSEHINQLNRYLSGQFGRFGVIVARNEVKKSVFKNTVDLWSGQRKCIICLDDEDIKQMVDVFESKQREPIEIVKKKFVEFIRACPS